LNEPSPLFPSAWRLRNMMEPHIAIESRVCAGSVSERAFLPHYEQMCGGNVD